MRRIGPRLALVLACLTLATTGFGRQQQVQAQQPAAAPVFGDERFGVTLTGDAQQLATLGSRWFITYSETPPPGTIPDSAVWVQYVGTSGSSPLPSNLAQRVAAHPGSSWLIGNEPNVWLSKSLEIQTGEQYARSLHDAVDVIKRTDPTAMIVGPNILNFDFTCVSCPGITSGHAWMDAFLASYQANYNGLPPIDVWSIHAYPLDFVHLPTVNFSLMEEQIIEYRAYLDAIPALAGMPIWVTEVGAIWGYEGLEWKDSGNGDFKAYPVGAFRTDLLLSYMRELLGWLSQNSSAMHIQRWFFFTTYYPGEPWQAMGGGINLLDGAGPGAALSPFGSLYRQLASLP
ncbi:MAG: glycosyl hydrolase [Dehalococcoidia bacterium]